MNGEIFATYALPVIVAALTAVAGFIGTQIKKLYEKYVNTKVKQDVAQTCVKAVEQLYHDLGGPEKLKKAQEGVRQMLEEKGIPISELELNLLIESVVSEFNYGFAKASEVVEEGGEANG
jgi:ribosomal protein L20A (L18A)